MVPSMNCWWFPYTYTWQAWGVYWDRSTSTTGERLKIGYTPLRAINRCQWSHGQILRCTVLPRYFAPKLVFRFRHITPPPPNKKKTPKTPKKKNNTRYCDPKIRRKRRTPTPRPAFWFTKAVLQRCRLGWITFESGWLGMPWIRFLGPWMLENCLLAVPNSLKIVWDWWSPWK